MAFATNSNFPVSGTLNSNTLYPVLVSNNSPLTYKLTSFCENNNVTEVVVVVDDSTQEHVLDYNEFLFEIRSKYDEIHDFMVIDEVLKAALPAMYTRVNSVYKRGE